MTILALIFIALTFIVLVTGIIIMARGGNVSKKLSNKLMVARVIMQALAIGSLLIMFIFYG